MSHSSKSQGGRSSLSTSCLVQREREGIWQYTKFLCSIPVRGRVKTAHQSCVKGRYSERKPERNREGLRERQRKEVTSRKKEVTKLGKGGKERQMRCGQLLCCSTPSFPCVSATSLPRFHSLHLSLSLSVCFSRASRSFTVQGRQANWWLGEVAWLWEDSHRRSLVGIQI